MKRTDLPAHIDTDTLHLDGGEWHVMSWNLEIKQSLCGTLLSRTCKTVEATEAEPDHLCGFCFPWNVRGL